MALELKDLSIGGMHWERDLLWLAVPEKRMIVTYAPATGETEEKLTYPHKIWDVCHGVEGLWMVTEGGRLGRQIVLWSLEEGRETRKFNCPDGSGAGLVVFAEKLWVTHRHNRKLFCLDPQSGKVSWIIRTEHETFSPAAYKNELWLVESDPGPLAHWSKTREHKYFFTRYDPAREKVLERIAVPFVPSCIAVDGVRFWYAEENKKGLSSTKKDRGQF